MGIFARPFTGDCPALTKRDTYKPVRKYIAIVSIYKAQNMQPKKRYRWEGKQASKAQFYKC